MISFRQQKVHFIFDIQSFGIILIINIKDIFFSILTILSFCGVVALFYIKAIPIRA